MRNKTAFTCPNCGETETVDVSMSFISTGAGGTLEYPKDGGEPREIERQGESKCDGCGEKFLYKFTFKVVAQTAKLPTYEEC